MLLDIKCSRSEIRKKPNRDTASLYQFTTDTFKNKKSVNQEKTKDAKTIEVTTSQRPKKKSEVRLSNKFSNRHCSAYQQRSQKSLGNKSQDTRTPIIQNKSPYNFKPASKKTSVLINHDYSLTKSACRLKSEKGDK